MTTRERILAAALDILKGEGFEKITVRRIASEAGVNVASVNYYFGSKEKLISTALEQILRDARRAFLYLDDPTLPPAARLKQFLFHYTRVGLANQDAMRKLLLYGKFDFESQQAYITFLKADGIEKVRRTLGEMTGIKDDEKLLMLTLQLFSVMLFPCLMAPFIKELFGYDIGADVALDDYFDLALGKYGAIDGGDQ